MKKRAKASAKSAGEGSGSVNKSALIRDMKAKNPGMKVAEIVAGMKEAGHSVSQALVYQAFRAGGKKRGRKKGSKVAASKAAAPKAAATKAAFKADLFSALQAFVNAAGSPDKAMSILKVFCE